MKKKLKLYLDTTLAKKAKATLFESNKVIDQVETDSPLKSIDRIIKKNKIQLSDVGEFDFNSGPGSFTGLRVGAAVVNTLNWALKKGKDSKEIKYE